MSGFNVCTSLLKNALDTSMNIAKNAAVVESSFSIYVSTKYFPI